MADDHTLIRAGIRNLLNDEPGVTVVGEAEDGQQAIELARQLRPDIVLMDIAMPGINGLDATLEIRRAVPGTAVLILSMYDSEEFFFRALRAGASGYLLKKAAVPELVFAIETVGAGRTYVTPSVAGLMVREYLRNAEREDAGYCDDLTDRECQILRLIAEDKSSKEIAALLGLSPKTVHNHRTNIMQKLNLHSATELVKYAIRRGLIDPNAR
ncbi:MAG: response regulator [Bacillota bacterium]